MLYPESVVAATNGSGENVFRVNCLNMLII
jgi:hypothetical protein